MKPTQYILDRQRLAKIVKHGMKTCHTCLVDFKEGDYVFSKNKSGTRRALRHYTCAERVNLV
jgi:hypothetical protein